MEDVSVAEPFDRSQQLPFGGFDGDDALQLDQSPPINPQSCLSNDTSD